MNVFFTRSLFLSCTISNVRVLLITPFSRCLFLPISSPEQGKLVKFGKSVLNELYLHMQIENAFPLAINLACMDLSTFLLHATSQQLAVISSSLMEICTSPYFLKLCLYESDSVLRSVI